MVRKRGVMRPQLITEHSVIYSDRKGRLLILPKAEAEHALRVAYESIPVQKPEQKETEP